MKDFFKRYSYLSVVLFVYQIAFALFGLALSTASGNASKTLQLALAIFSVLFYLTIVYIKVWEFGAKDRISADYNKIKRRPWLGAYIGLLASIPNILLFLLITLGAFVPSLSSFGAVCRVIAILCEGMYSGLLAQRINDVPLNQMFFMFGIIILPLIATTFLSYFAGFFNFRIIPDKNNKK